MKVKHIPILFENEDCIIFNKPAGLPVQGGAGINVSLDQILTETQRPRLLLVHRLDKDTSGVILVAKHKQAAARFSGLFSKTRGIAKYYLGVCAGTPQKDPGTIRLALEIRGASKQAETAYKRLSGNQDWSLLELELGTGRMHQIRRHLALIGNPLLGDDKYGNFSLNKELRKTKGLKRLLLHASRLVGAETSVGFPLDITAPLPDYFNSFLFNLAEIQKD
ncbi:MAG: RluA family pseudouridine synthase [Treponema sp.]|jgi:23S rRNA pseudouridine955/2504/2580 synthase|nr:RluA family pseudouridine synthase [Treponema sp.]